ncbi:hypothetical protein Q9189_001820 [Teloschistes chrysophthalmus]
MKADKASVQDEDAGQEHDDQQASQLLEGVKSPKEDVAAVTLSPMQHEQDHFLVRAFVQPILPDPMVAAMHSHQYDDMWMQAYGMAEEYLEEWVSNLHMHTLYSRWDLLKDRDQIKLTATSNSGVQVERSVTIKTKTGVSGGRGLWARIDTSGYETQETTIDLRRGVRVLKRKVTEQFGDHVHVPPSELYQSLKL